MYDAKSDRKKTPDSISNDNAIRANTVDDIAPEGSTTPDWNTKDDIAPEGSNTPDSISKNNTIRANTQADTDGTNNARIHSHGAEVLCLYVRVLNVSLGSPTYTSSLVKVAERSIGLFTSTARLARGSFPNTFRAASALALCRVDMCCRWQTYYNCVTHTDMAARQRYHSPSKHLAIV